MIGRRNYGLFIVVCLIFGNTFLAISMGLKAGASPLFFAALRFIAAGFIMLMFLLGMGKTSLSKLRPLVSRSLLLGLFNVSGTFGFMFLAQTQVDSGFMARLDATGPILTAAFAAVFLRKKLRGLHLLAFALGTGGAFLIASPAASTQAVYLVFAVLSVFMYAFANALYPMLFKKQEDSILINALQSLGGGLVLLLVSVFVETPALPPASLLPLAYLIVAGSIIAHSAVLVLIRDVGPVFASSWLYVAPCIASLSGALVLGEGISLGGIIGTVLALLGTFILARAEQKAPATPVSADSIASP